MLPEPKDLQEEAMHHDSPFPGDRTEAWLLGSLLRWNAAIADVAVFIRAENFRVDAHQHIYRAIVSLWDAGKPVDTVTVAEALHRAGQVENIGGYGLLADLWDAIPTGASAVHYAHLVHNASLLRELEMAGHAIVQSAARPTGTAIEALEAAEKAIFAIADVGAEGQAVLLEQAIIESQDRLDERMQGSLTCSGLRSGIDDLDEITAGLQPSELTVLAARPSLGKTALALAIARNVAANKVGVFFVSLEMKRTDLADRLACAEAGLELSELRHTRFSPESMRRFVDAGQALSALPLHIDDISTQSMLHIASVARRLKLRKGIGLVVVDYLQLIEPEDRRAPRHEQVAGVSRRLKTLAGELKLPILALAQLNREVEGRPQGRPRLSDLRESGGIEADADCVLLLHRNSDHPHLLEIMVAKQRNGPIGEIAVNYDRAKMRFAPYLDSDPFHDSL